MVNKVLEKYFEIIKENFGAAYDIALQNNFDRQKYEPLIKKIYDQKLAETTLQTLYCSLKSLDWNLLETEIKNSHGLKVGYVGGEYMYEQQVSATEDFLKRSGLYADTIVIEEQIFGQLLHTNRRKYNASWIDFNYISNDAIEYLALEPLFYSDDEVPICMFAPSRYLDEALENQTWQIARKTAVDYANELLGRNFSHYRELEEYLSTIRSDEEFLKLISAGKELYTQTGDLIDQNFIKGFKEIFQIKYPDMESAYYEAFLFGQHPFRVFDLEFNGRYRTTPVTNYKQTWDSLVWLMKKDNDAIFKEIKTSRLSKDSLVIRALNEEQKLLGNIPLDKLKILRERGELADLRELIGKNILEIEQASDDEFVETASRVSYNIKTALKKHDKNIKDLDEKYKRLIDFSLIGANTCIISGAISFAASAYQPLALAAGLLGGVTFSLQTAKQYLEYRDKVKELQAKPVALLYQADKNDVNK